MRIGVVIISVVAACGARTDICVDGPCPETGEEDEHARQCEGSLSDPPGCTGTGLIAVLEDECIDDSGDAGTGDRLEVYCLGGIARFCLSHEACPWRDGSTTSDDMTCSTSGLVSSYMASTIDGCIGWWGFNVYCCSADGRMGVGQ
jgi:hypothetical protein